MKQKHSSLKAPYAFSSVLVVAATDVFTGEYISRPAQNGGRQVENKAIWGKPRNFMAKRFFKPEHYALALTVVHEMMKMSQPELTGIADGNVSVVNKFIADSGFPDTQLDPVGPDGFAVAVVIKMLRHFKFPAERGYDLGIGMKVGNRFDKGTFKVFADVKSGRRLFGIPLSNGDRFYVLDNGLITQSATLNMDIYQIMTGGDFREVKAPNGLILPNVKFDIEVDMSWLEGSEVSNVTRSLWYVAQALKQVRFSLGPNGIFFEAVVAMSFEKGMSFAKEPKNGDILMNQDCTMWLCTGKNFFPAWVAAVPTSSFEYKTVVIPHKL